VNNESQPKPTQAEADSPALAQFEDRLDRHGSDLACWPDAERAAAEALLRDSPAGRVALAQAAALEERLAAFPAPDPSPALRRNLLADFAAQRARGSWLDALWRQIGGIRVALPAMATALALGVAVGSWLPAPASDIGDSGNEDALALLQYELGDDSEW